MDKKQERLHELAMKFYHELEGPSENEYVDLFYCLITGDEARLVRLLESNGVRTDKEDGE